jgi:hypothetical protein
MNEERIQELERRVKTLERAIQVTPSRIVIQKPVLIKGTIHADRVYTARTGSFVELTT